MCAARNIPSHASVPTLKASSDFQRISREGQKWFCPAFVILVSQKDKEAPFRLGLTASRKVGNAVIRNKAKRRLREIVRLLARAQPLQGFDLVLVAKTDAAHRDFKEMQKDLNWGLRKLGLLPK